MRHLKRTAKLGRTGEHRNAMLANLVCSLIKHSRITTTLAKAKAARPVAEKMVTLGKRGTLQDRRLAAARLRAQGRSLHKSREKRLAWREHHDVVRILFEQIAPKFKDRPGGYTRILKLRQRDGDAALLAILEWVDTVVEAPAEQPAESSPKKDKKKDEAKSDADKSTQPPAAGAESTGEKPATE